MTMTNEQRRLQESDERTKHWKRWGPYLSERAWGTVREDYSATGEAWDYFPHDHARSRAYRWNEDGIAGICDRHQNLCFALALWNEKDAILKERIFGLTGSEGNHGEDVKEYYYYVDNTPTHSYMKYLYKYPQSAFPYEELLRVNRSRSKSEPEFELADTGVFDENKYFDVSIEYAKVDIEDIAVRITVANRGPEAARVRLLPTLWFRNTWSWAPGMPCSLLTGTEGAIHATCIEMGDYELTWDGQAEVLFTENNTNFAKLYGGENTTPYVKDSFHRYVVEKETDAVNPAHTGTKAAIHYTLEVPAESEVVVRLRLRNAACPISISGFGADFENIFTVAKHEADEFYDAIAPSNIDADTKAIQRQAFAGLLWSKQFYHFVIEQWLEGDPNFGTPPAARKEGRNSGWRHLYNADVISMPDKWEYPWYAAWDLAFHCVAFAHIDPEFAKEQLLLMLREWYMHPNGQIPAYEWAFGDVNPPVHAWAALQVYQIEKMRTGTGDRAFLERVFHKLLLNFTWWVNRKDIEGRNVFQGGFLGLDNIGVFDRSSMLPAGGHIEQSDGTSWMAMYSLDLLAIAMELAHEDPTYEDVASKFWEHFVYIAQAINDVDEDGIGLWNTEDGLFYDVLHMADGKRFPMKVRSMVGLIPLYAVQVLEPKLLNQMPAFKRRLDWFISNRPELIKNMACMKREGQMDRRLFSITSQEQLERILSVMLDESEFLSGYGIRALSRRHLAKPYTLTVLGQEHSVHYEPAESSTGLFGGNSNWRGPIWMPVNYLLVQALRRFHVYYGSEFKVECPTGSGNFMNLDEVADEITSRLIRIFQRDGDGKRPVLGQNRMQQTDPHWRDLVPFHEYFNGDSGSGVGASHQTGWTALAACLIFDLHGSKNMTGDEADKAAVTA